MAETTGVAALVNILDVDSLKISLGFTIDVSPAGKPVVIRITFPGRYADHVAAMEGMCSLPLAPKVNLPKTVSAEGKVTCRQLGKASSGRNLAILLCSLTGMAFPKACTDEQIRAGLTLAGRDIPEAYQVKTVPPVPHIETSPVAVGAGKKGK